MTINCLNYIILSRGNSSYVWHTWPELVLFFQAEAGHLVHVFDVFDVYGYSRLPFDQNVDWDVIWAHEYPFKTYADKIEFSNLKPHQKVMFSLFQYSKKCYIIRSCIFIFCIILYKVVSLIFFGILAGYYGSANVKGRVVINNFFKNWCYRLFDYFTSFFLG